MKTCLSSDYDKFTKSEEVCKLRIPVFKSGVPSEQGGRWVRFPCTSANYFKWLAKQADWLSESTKAIGSRYGVDEILRCSFLGLRTRRERSAFSH